MAGRRRAVDLDAVDFMCNEFAEWALFWVARPDWGPHQYQRLYARKIGSDQVTFGDAYGEFEEGSRETPGSRGERTFKVETLKRVIDHTELPRTTGGHFGNRTEESVRYVTSCGQIRVVRLAALRAIIEDAEALP